MRRYYSRPRQPNESYVTFLFPMRIKVKITPSSKIQKVAKKSGIFYVVSVKSAAKKGRANKEALKLLADYFKVAPSNIKIVSGLRNRIKWIELEDGENNQKKLIDL